MADPSPILEPSTNHPWWLVTIVASAGGVEALQYLLTRWPQNLPAAVVIVQHRAAERDNSVLRQILSRVTLVPVLTADENESIHAGRIYVARSDLHLTVSSEKRFSYIDGRKIRFVSSAANPLFSSAAAAFENRLIAVVLTGYGMDATDGVQTVKAHGGFVIAEDPLTARHGGMPQAAINTGSVDLILPLEAIAPALMVIIRGEVPTGVRSN